MIPIDADGDEVSPRRMAAMHAAGFAAAATTRVDSRAG